jgi:branched-chain amino acid transport system substrate-binding protein
MNKKIIWGIILVIVVVILIGLGFNKDKTQVSDNTQTGSEAKLRIGAILPLTGPIAEAGQFAKQGIEEALLDLGKANNLHVEVVFEDGRYDPKTSLDAYTKLKSIDKVDALIVFGSPTAMSLSPGVNADKIPMLALTAASAYSTPNDFTFRSVGHADSEAKFASEVLVDKLGKKKIAVMYLNNDYGIGGLASFKKYIQGKAEVVAAEGSESGTSDFRSQLAKVKSAAPDAVFIISTYKEAGLMLKQAKEIGVTGPFVCGQPCDFKEVINTAGIDAAEDLIVVTTTDQARSEFMDQYEKKYGNNPSYITIRHYDSLVVLNDVATRCFSEDSDGECLRKELDNVTNFPGLSFPISYDVNGDVTDTFILKTIKNGMFEPYTI